MRELANHWIQRADFSSSEYGSADEATVLGVFRSHPWQDEARLLQGREEKGEEFCPPGLGLNARNGDTLHVCAMSPGEWMVHCHYGESDRKGKRVETHEHVTAQQAEQMIHQFFLGAQATPV